ncbi:hypothetical protein PSU4_46180 [Pseudonocardia sulfidoxydans NBRC 16205]|uniref:RNA polymerase sigma factor n=1 Tax=Pseudonocardia sulfidoxydans NBRC 16205 TaxID=1223511 RepID=A0A511DPD5_9PSEU|nr:sigma-70 family RNA polymerase sigma factor [Pseudonocardia sulfidoxydans]GEL25664.1 hypothetical protein PSU4_46180 [Pseudonocardia sulfidoxydans NBRC 16205]
MLTPTVEAAPDADSPHDTGRDFEEIRRRLFGIAYKMLGRPTDAEDVVQDVWLRWQGIDRTRVRDQVAYLVTITTRLALNAATSAHARREISTGGSLPEPNAATADPLAQLERHESLESAVELLVERLSPVERAVYVLREAFDYPFREIASILATSEANARQLARRARMHMAGQRLQPVTPSDRDELLAAFVRASRAGEMASLLTVLTCGPTAGPQAHLGSRRCLAQVAS